MSEYGWPAAPDVPDADDDHASRLVHLRDGRVVLLRPAGAADAHGLLSALNDVAGEGRFLLRRAWQLTPELEQRWLRVALGGVDLLLVAWLLDDAEMRRELEVAGSLSLVRGRPEFIRHTADLSMWLRSGFREQGLGSAFLETALAWAAAQDTLEKITLSVRSSNRRALNLYTKYGFVVEGRRRAFVKTEAGYEDEILLSRFVGAAPPEAATEAPAGMPSDDQEDPEDDTL